MAKRDNLIKRIISSIFYKKSNKYSFYDHLNEFNFKYDYKINH